MEELLMCSVCIERYHENKRHPVLLPRCGHSFCRPCISLLVSAGCIVCPTCRTDQRIDYVERLPTEYTLLAIINAQENNKRETCERHMVKLSFWCRTCSISTCGECLFEDHPTHSHDVIRAAKYIEDMKHNAQIVAIKFIEALDEREQNYYKVIFTSAKKISNAIRSIGVLRKDMEEARELMKGIKEDEGISAAKSLSEAAKFLGLKWNIQDANFNRQVKEEKVKDEIELEKERAHEAFAKEEERKAKEKEKVKSKDGKRVLRKSKTLSTVELHREVENFSENEKPEANVKAPEKSDTQKSIDKVPETSQKAENAKPKETDKADESKQLEEKKNKENLKSELKKVVDVKAKENGKPEELTIEDIIKMKSLLKKTDDLINHEEQKDLKSNNKLEMKKVSDVKLKEIEKPEEFTIQDVIKIKELLRTFDELKDFKDFKEANNKIDKIVDLALVKPKSKFLKIKPLSKKLPSSVSTIAANEKTQAEALPVIQEKSTPTAAEEKTTVASSNEKTTVTSADDKTVVASSDEKTAVSSADQKISAATSDSSAPKASFEPKNETEPLTNGKDFSDSEEEDDVEDHQKEENTLQAAAITVNADSGLSKDSREKKIKDPMDSIEEGKLVDFIQVPGFMICVEAADGRLGAIVWGPQGLHVHCLQFMHVTYDIVIRDNILNTMISSKSPTVFFELTAEQTVIGRVYIKLWGHLRRAQNFLSLCLGDQGKSYMNTKFLQVYNVSGSGERILGGDYESNNGRGGKGLLDDLEWNGDYAMPMKAGMITAAGSGQQATNSLFLICTQSDASRNFSCPFGLVCEGLKVVKDAVQQSATKQIWITDCGVVLVPPSFESSMSS